MPTFMKMFFSMNKGFGAPKRLLIPLKFPCRFKFCMLPTKVSHSKASCYGASKWRFFVCQSTCGLCGTSQDNLMMTWFLGDEMTLKTTLLVWEPMVISNGLISWVFGFDKYFDYQWFQPTLVCSFPLELTCIITLILCP